MAGNGAPWLITLEGIVDGDAALADVVERLQHETRKPADEWRRALVAPALGRIVLPAHTRDEGTRIGAQLANAGLVPHVVEAAELKSAVDAAFSAVWAERDRDSLLCIAEDGRSLDVPSGSIRLVVSGRQVKNGLGEHFVVLGLRDGCGAVVFRFPGADVSKLVGARETPEDMVSAFLDVLGRTIAPHALIDRGLERGSKLAGLKEIGADDLAAGGIVAAFMHRRFPPKPRAQQPMPAPSFAPPPQPASLELGARKGPARPAPSFAEPDPAPARASSMSSSMASSMASSMTSSKSVSPEQKRKRMMAAGVVAVIAIVAGFAVLHTPAKSEHLLHLHDAWKSPYGITFTYESSFNAGIADVPDLGFVVTATKFGDSKTFRVPHVDEQTLRDAFGIAWHITTADDSGGTWISLEAKKP